jgi:hypothetical protein
VSDPQFQALLHLQVMLYPSMYPCIHSMSLAVGRCTHRYLHQPLRSIHLVLRLEIRLGRLLSYDHICRILHLIQHHKRLGKKIWLPVTQSYLQLLGVLFFYSFLTPKKNSWLLRNILAVVFVNYTYQYYTSYP